MKKYKNKKEAEDNELSDNRKKARYYNYQEREEICKYFEKKKYIRWAKLANSY